MIEAAGGTDLRGEAGAMSYPMKWEDVISAQPDIIVLAPCSFSIDRTLRELDTVASVPGWTRLPAVRERRIFAVEAAPYFSRSGPRLIDGAELLAQLFHPTVFGATLPQGARRVAA
jgi:iron complex transport system substrate-binding protein